MITRLDHLVVAAADLAQGVAWVRDRLGVEVPYGGEHPAMGTHNHLMKLGEDCFLEVIAIDPAARSPGRPRWFGLDDPSVRQRLAIQPALLSWVVNSDGLVRLLAEAGCPYGRAEPVSRGTLHWQFGMPEDGRLLGGGLLPYTIQWPSDRHPAAAMADRGCRLQMLNLYHPYPDWLAEMLDSINASNLVDIQSLSPDQAPYLAATIDTPSGAKRLESPL